jgi:YihY family inner membrane protein
MSERLDSFQRRHKALGFPLGVLYKFFDDQGNYLAALMTYYAFIALIPLLLLASSILGFILHGSPGLQQDILDSALAQFPVVHDLLNQEGGPRGSTWAAIIGALGALYGAMGVAQATQNAMNIAWAVPRNKRPNPFTGRLRSLGLLITAGIGILATTWVSTLGSDVDALNTNITPWLKIALLALTVTVNAMIFTLLFRLATTHEHSLLLAIPGAFVTSTLWQVLQYGGAFYVTQVIQHASRANQYFAGFLGLIGYLYLGSLCVILGVEVNVVKAHRLYPRALLTPFTDNVNLTDADRRAYADYAAAQRTKDFAHVDVRFEYDGQYRSARRRAAAERAAREAADQRLKEHNELTEARKRKEARARTGEEPPTGSMNP